MTRLAEGLAGTGTHDPARAEITLFAVRGISDVAATLDDAAGPGESESESERGPWRERRIFSPAQRHRQDLVLPYAVRARSPALMESLASVHADRGFDVVVVTHGLSVAPALLPHGLPLVIDEHDVNSRYARRALSMGDRSPGRLRDAVVMPYFERAAWRRASAVCVVGEDEERVVRPFCPRTIVVRNGVDVEARRFILPSRRRGHKILFLGYFAYDPNADAARFLAREVLPLVRREVRDATLTLVGRDPPRDLLSLRDEGLEITGAVPDLGPVLDEHAVFLNGVRTGAGTSLKVLDAFAAGLPVVSTRFGVRGLTSRPDAVALLADDPACLAATVVRALRAPSEYDEMARQARALAEERSWRVSQRVFADAVRAAAGD